MHKWEYRVLLQMWDDEEHVYYWHEGEERYERNVLQRLNDAGQEGWELVTIEPGPEQSINYFFKRPLA